MNPLLSTLIRVARNIQYAYWSVRRPLTLGVKALVIDQSDNVALVRHGYEPGWQLPGGGVERGETLKQAVLREVREELSLEFTSEEAEFVGMYFHVSHGRSDHIALFLVRPQSLALPPFKPGLEIAERGVFSTSKLPLETTDATRRRVAEFRGEADRESPGQW